MAEVDFAGMLNRKYQILAQDADARTTAANAGANLQNVQAQLAPGQALAHNALLGAQTADTAVHTNLAPGIAGSENALRGAQANFTGVQASVLPGVSAAQVDASRAGTDFTRTQNRVTNFNATPFSRDELLQSGVSRSLGFSTGTAKVPGKGSGKVDTVKAVLAPGEAVLNKAAAEHLGRGFIKELNDYGALKMGMVQGTEDDRASAKGSAAQPDDKATPAPAKDDRAAFAKGTAYIPGEEVLHDAMRGVAPPMPIQSGNVMTPAQGGGMVTPAVQAPPVTLAQLQRAVAAGPGAELPTNNPGVFTLTPQMMRTPLLGNPVGPIQDTRFYNNLWRDPGTTPAVQGGGATVGYAKGTSKVAKGAKGKGKPSDTSKPDPKALAAVMQMLAGAGGGMAGAGPQAGAGGPPPMAGGMAPPAAPLKKGGAPSFAMGTEEVMAAY